MAIVIQLSGPTGVVHAGDVEPEVKRLDTGFFQITARQRIARRTVAFTIMISPETMAAMQALAEKADVA
jgi:hypothetical protein